MRIATQETSPIQPVFMPKNASSKSTLPPLFSTASGVAEETPSAVEKSVILEVKEIKRKHLAASAGFIIF